MSQADRTLNICVAVLFGVLLAIIIGLSIASAIWEVHTQHFVFDKSYYLYYPFHITLFFKDIFNTLAIYILLLIIFMLDAISASYCGWAVVCGQRLPDRRLHAPEHGNLPHPVEQFRAD